MAVYHIGIVGTVLTKPQKVATYIKTGFSDRVKKPNEAKMGWKVDEY